VSNVPDRIERLVRSARADLDVAHAGRRRGVVTRVADDVALVSGLTDAGYEDLVTFDAGSVGMAFDLAAGDVTGVVLLTKPGLVTTGQGAAGAGAPPTLPVGPDALGRILDPLGLPLDGGSRPSGSPRPLFGRALEFVERKNVDRPLHTGVLVLDAAVPIGRGQRELIIGDRNTGKTSLVLDVVAAQRAGDVVCVYVLIGQPLSRVLSLHAELERAGAADNTVVIAADASMSAGMQYLAPYAGAAVAEAFRDQGRDVLVVYDDLTKHADTYRQLALLLERPPGREAFPGDIFYIHAELLERACARRPDLGGGSITALPLAETSDGDISAYIPTNLISITDGQIYLDAGRHARNQRPAVDIGRSVSRIGGKAQPAAMRHAARNLRILMARFEELEGLTRIGLEVDPATERTIRRGRVTRELMRQSRFDARTPAEQVLTLTAVTNGWLDEQDPSTARDVVRRAVAQLASEQAAVVDTLNAANIPEGNWESDFKQRVERVLSGGAS
jgi:F-type H+-transporting ATPase subunit alpha